VAEVQGRSISRSQSGAQCGRVEVHHYPHQQRLSPSLPGRRCSTAHFLDETVLSALDRLADPQIQVMTWRQIRR